MNKWYLIIVISMLGVSSCALFETTELLPMFIEINSVKLKTNLDQGTDHHDIIDIWPAADGQSVGVFELPTTFPVLDDNTETKMFYQAGVKRAGFSEDHIIYPFYGLIELDRTFEPNTTLVEDLEFEYRDDAVIRMTEDFSDPHIFERAVDQDSVTNMIAVNDDCAEGNCGLIILTTENPEFAAATTDGYADVPTNGTPVFLELEYKTEINLSIGLQSSVNGNDFNEFFIILTPTDTWKKAYIDMAEVLQASQLDSYRIVIGALNTTGETVELRVDNVKLLHF